MIFQTTSCCHWDTEQVPDPKQLTAAMCPVLISHHSLVPQLHLPGKGEKHRALPKPTMFCHARVPGQRMEKTFADHQYSCPYQETLASTWLRSGLSPGCRAEYSLACPLCSSAGALIPPPHLEVTRSPYFWRGHLGSGDVPTEQLFGSCIPFGEKQLPQHPRQDFSFLPRRSHMGGLDLRRARAGLLAGGFPEIHPLVRGPPSRRCCQLPNPH